jgi:protoheme IX farnesyltransferase
MTANPALVAPSAKFSDYFELTKPRLSLLSMLTALAAYAAARPEFSTAKLIFVALGTSLAAGGVAVLNQWLESDTDSQMKRTADRPIPTGKVATGSAFVLGGLMCVGALFILFSRVNYLCAGVALLTMIAYLGWYTPAKRWSRWSTEIGAIAGALPPLIGWTAAEGRVSELGWIFFGILFFWQIPHFMAIAWTHRRDYSAVHFPMLPVRNEKGGFVAAWSLANTLGLLVVSLLPWALGYATAWSGAVALAGGAGFVACAVLFLRAEGRDVAARRLFHCSIAYLPLVLGALVADRIINF